MNTLFLAKAIYILGILNIVGLLLVFFSCRCLPGMRWLKPLWGAAWYRAFYRRHCWYWYFFFVSVFLHAVLAMYLYGNPFTN